MRDKKKHGVAAMILGIGKKRDSDDDDEKEDKKSGGDLEAIAEDIIKAVKDEDASDLAEALEALYQSWSDEKDDDSGCDCED